MSSSLIITLEITLVLGSVVGWGLWELWSLRRDKKKSLLKPPHDEGPP